METRRLRAVLLAITTVAGSVGLGSLPAFAVIVPPPVVPTGGARTSPVISTLHPRITRVSPNRFGPRNGQSAAFRVFLPGPERLSFVVRNGNGQTIQGPHAPGALGGGTHTFHWDGKNNAGRIAGDGLYTIVVTTSATSARATLHGAATATIRVDDTPPALSGINGSGMTFYPVVDGYSDTFGPRVHVNEGGSLWLEVFTTSGSRVKVIAHPHATAGTFQLTWNGRNSDGGMAAAGAYRYQFVAADTSGNRRGSTKATAYVSHQRLTNQTVSYSEDGNQGQIGASDVACTQYSYALSTFAAGVWLDNFCDETFDGFQTIAAAYDFAVPAAVHYNAIEVQSYGASIDTPEAIAAIIYNFSTKTDDVVGAVSLTQYGVATLSTYGTVAATGRVSGGHVVVGIAVPDRSGLSEDYDLGTVGITVSYQVLQ